MAVKIFNDRATFLLKAADGAKLKVPPMGFMDIPEKFTGDITFKMAVKARVIKVFETTKQGDKLEQQAYEPAKTEQPAEAPEQTEEQAPEVTDQPDKEEQPAKAGKTDKKGQAAKSAKG